MVPISRCQALKRTVPQNCRLMFRWAASQAGHLMWCWRSLMACCFLAKRLRRPGPSERPTRTESGLGNSRRD